MFSKSKKIPKSNEFGDTHQLKICALHKNLVQSFKISGSGVGSSKLADDKPRMAWLC